MGFLRDFALNIPERQLNILWVLAPRPQSLLGVAYCLTSLRTIPSQKDLRAQQASTRTIPDQKAIFVERVPRAGYSPNHIISYLQLTIDDQADDPIEERDFIDRFPE